jgi:hypothetical protein
VRVTAVDESGNDQRRPWQGTGVEKVEQQQNFTLQATTDILWGLAARCPDSALGWLSLGWRLGLLDLDARIGAAGWDMIGPEWAEVTRQPTFAELQRRRSEAPAEVHQRALRAGAR